MLFLMARTMPRARFVGAWVRAASTHPTVAAALIALLLILSWLVAYAIGGANVAAPHWFYVPVAVAASRFGHRGAALASLGAAVLSGPLLPADVAAGLAQTPIDWGTRAAFFIAMGQFLAWLIDSHTRAQRDLQATRQTVSLLEGLLDRENGDRAAARSVVHSIEEVLSAGGPAIVFQPIVDIRDGRVHGVEALSRFDLEPRKGPDYWFEAAWKTGLGLELELAALRAALREAAFLSDDLFVAVNLAPEALASPEFLELLPSIAADRLTIEVTEHARVDDYESLSDPVRELRKRGGRLAIDDVGSGFASLRHILRLDPDVIKMDVELTRGIDVDRRRRALASGLVSFAAELGCWVVSEGIEAHSELQALQALGVRYGQGYFLCVPTPLSDLDLGWPSRALQSAQIRTG